MPNVNRPNLYFDYDGMGNRIRKRVVRNPASNQVETSTWYVRDPQGNVMAVYRTRRDTTWLVEHHLYGADRLGICGLEQVMDTPQDDTDPDEGDGSAKKTNNNSLPPKAEVPAKNAYFRTKGCREYELKNHLGNVLGVVSDLKFGENPDSSLRYYAQLLSVGDYYPFGMEMVGRYWEGSDYRYGFQGQEGDDEVAGSGNSVFFKYRVHDPRIGRFLSVDPLVASYPGNGPYNFSENVVINFIELEGLEKLDATKGRFMGKTMEELGVADGGNIIIGNIYEYETSKGNKVRSLFSTHVSVELYYIQYYNIVNGTPENEPFNSEIVDYNHLPPDSYTPNIKHKVTRLKGMFWVPIPKLAGDYSGLENNCFGPALGTKGGIYDVNWVAQVLNDNYEMVYSLKEENVLEKLEVGMVGVSQINGVLHHGVEVVGMDDKGHPIFLSDYQKLEPMTGSWDEIKNEMLLPTGTETDPEQYLWFRPKQ